MPPFDVVRCPICTLLFVSPRLGPDALQRLYDEPEYFEGPTGVYGDPGSLSAAMILQRTWMAGRLATLARFAPPPATLLEVGRGYGLFLDAARLAGYTVRGVELSHTAADHARGQLDLDVFCGQLADAPTEPADVICAFDTIEHVPDPLEFLRAVRSRFAAGGTVILTLPYADSLPARLLHSHWWTLKPEQHITHFTVPTLRLVAARAGLAITGVIRSPLSRPNLGRLDVLVAVGRALPG
jgi:SAM-dependent methyltransferase